MASHAQVIPTQFVERTMAKVAHLLRSEHILVSCAKVRACNTTQRRVCAAIVCAGYGTPLMHHQLELEILYAPGTHIWSQTALITE